MTTLTRRPAPASAEAPAEPPASARRRRVLGYSLLAVLSYIPPLLTAPGKVAADTKQYLYLDPTRLLERAPSMWDLNIGLGTVTHQNIGYVFPMGTVEHLVEHSVKPSSSTRSPKVTLQPGQVPRDFSSDCLPGLTGCCRFAWSSAMCSWVASMRSRTFRATLAACSSAPSAGMTRIRFNGRRAPRPLSQVGDRLPCVPALSSTCRVGHDRRWGR